MRRILLTAALVLAACGEGDETTGTTSTTAPTTDQASPDTSAPPSTSEPPSGPVEVGQLETVVAGMDVPWEIAFVDADTLLVTERGGTVRVVREGAVREEPALEVDVVPQGEGGLLGMALHPEFPDERTVYLYLTTEQGNRVARFDVGDDLELTGERVVLDGIPANVFHDGGRIAFGPDDMLYVTTGDAQDPALAADLSSLAGKILRIAPDGSVPADNPFEGSPVWSYGHRNAQGLGWDADGQLFASEHGPTGEFGLCCNDEINRIEAGGFYGWPHVVGDTQAAGGQPPAEPIPPIATSGNDATWAPTGLAVVGEGRHRTLLLATLVSAELLRFDLGEQITAAPEPTAVTDHGDRLRLVTTGPDGCLWVATSNRDGRGDPAAEDDRLLRTC